jgi:PAS domain S-box-containing protein
LDGKHTLIGIYEIDLNKGVFLQVSQVICEGLGYKEEELIGQPVSKVLTPESVEHFKHRLDRMKHGEMLDGKVEYIAVAKNGVQVPVTIEAFYKIANGKIVGAIVAVQEIANG